MFCFVLFCFVLFCFVLFCFVLFCFVLFCFVLFCFVLFCLFCLFCFVLFYSVHVCLFIIVPSFHLKTIFFFFSGMKESHLSEMTLSHESAGFFVFFLFFYQNFKIGFINFILI